LQNKRIRLTELAESFQSIFEKVPRPWIDCQFIRMDDDDLLEILVPGQWCVIIDVEYGQSIDLDTVYFVSSFDELLHFIVTYGPIIIRENPENLEETMVNRLADISGDLITMGKGVIANDTASVVNFIKTYNDKMIRINQIAYFEIVDQKLIEELTNND
jgi:hypothetical protein